MAGNKFVPKITQDGATVGPSPRRPFTGARESAKGMSFAHQMNMPKLPGAPNVQAPKKIGTAPSLFPQGGVKTGLSSIGKM